MFLKSPEPFNILPLHGLIKQTLSIMSKMRNKKNLLSILHDRKKIENMFSREQGKEIAHQKQTTSEMVSFAQD